MSLSFLLKSKVSSHCKRIWSSENLLRVIAVIATRLVVIFVWSGVVWSLLGSNAFPLQYFIGRNGSNCITIRSIDLTALENGSTVVENDTLLRPLPSSEFSLLSLSFDNVLNEYKLVQIKKSQQCDNLLELQKVNVDLNWTALSTAKTAVININDFTMQEPADLIHIPDGHFFALMLLLIFSSLCGYIVKLIFLPPLFGMVIAGIILRNVPYIDYAKDIHPTWSSTIRNIALVIILIRGGLSMKLKDLKVLKHAVLILGSIPCILEGAVDGIIATFYLKMPWQWGFMLG